MEVVFVLYNLNAGSTIMKGIQPAEHLGVSHVEHQYLEYSTISNKILVFVGALWHTFDLSPDKILDLQSRNNIIIHEPVDNYCYHSPLDLGPKYHKSDIERQLTEIVDAILTPNMRILERLKSIVKKDCILQNMPHNIDEHFYEVSQEQNDTFCIGYGGTLYSNEFLFNKPVHYLSIMSPQDGYTDDVLRFLKQHTCHFSHRKSDTIDFMMKGGIKVATASACRSPIVISRDWAAIDLLPEDYPLFVSDDREDVIEKIEYAKSIFGKAEWYELLDILVEIKERTSLDNLKSDYLKVFNHFGWEEKK